MFASIDEKRHALVGRWTQCSKQGIGGAESVGIEITSDGLFTVLVRDAIGAVVPGKGGSLEGCVDVTPPVKQVDGYSVERSSGPRSAGHCSM